MTVEKMSWPEQKSFAFTVFDDTDWETVDNVGPVYAFLQEHGFRTTKSIWPNAVSRQPYIGGDTGANPAYLAWVKSLHRSGFGLGFHMATAHTSCRAQTLAGLQTFYRAFGHWPEAMANHADCEENIYWGDARLSGLNRLLYNLLTRGQNRNRYRGHREGQPLFWGDLCREYITYVRNFVFSDINTLKACPFMPYHDPARPYVNFWFASSEGPEVTTYTQTISEENQDRLEAEGGACLMYTHFANGFCQEGRLQPRFVALMKRLAQKNGWFVPVATLLDYLRAQNGGHLITNRERRHLETTWLWQKIRRGTT